MSTIEQRYIDMTNHLILTRMICSFISIPFCLIIIILYIILCFQVLFNKNKAAKANSLSNESRITPNLTNKVSLGNHFMFILILCNLISSIIPIIFFFYYDMDKSTINSTLCYVLGFFHNFFDGCACCVTSVIVFLFYISTKMTEFKPGQEKRLLIFGILYFIISATIFTTLPILPFTDNPAYNLAGTHCSFNYKQYWNYVFTVFVALNCGISTLCLIIVSAFYIKKLKQMDKESHEYKMIKRFITVFIIFPVILVISRFAKGAGRLFSKDKNEEVSSEPESDFVFYSKAVIAYAGATLYCLNGFFNSGICFYFFRGVFKCLKDDKEESMINKEHEHTISMQQIHEEPEYDDD